MVQIKYSTTLLYMIYLYIIYVIQYIYLYFFCYEIKTNLNFFIKMLCSKVY